MKRTFILTMLIGFFIHSATAQSTNLTEFFSKADAFFQKNVNQGVVNYKSLSTETAIFNVLLELTWNANLKNESAETRKAFWINAYNITCIHAVLKHNGIQSPLDVEGFFTIERHKVAGEFLTLSDIENKKLMAEFNDPRLHFVLVCAAKGCPKLASTAFTDQGLEKQIEDRTRVILNSPEFTKYQADTYALKVSEIFSWYAKDFEAAGGTVEFINQYYQTHIPTSLKVEFYPYDWKLNSQ